MNSFEAEVRKSAERLGLHYHKLPVAQARGRALRKSPYDAFAVGYRGRHVALELKSQKAFGRFDLARVKTHQRDALSRVVREGGLAFLVINMRGARVNGKWRSQNRAWYFDWYGWDLLQLSLARQQRSSVPAAWFAAPGDFFVTELRRLDWPVEDGKTEKVWDLGPLLDR